MRHLIKIIVPVSLALVVGLSINSIVTSVGDALTNINTAHRAALEIPFNE